MRCAPGTRSFGYNANGDMTTRTFNGQSSTMARDPLHRVTQGGNTTNFVYDANSQRLLRKDPGSTTLYLDRTELNRTGSTMLTVPAYVGERSDYTPIGAHHGALGR